MICPHCNQPSRYRERSSRKCPKCKREFAFEPRTHPLKLHDIRFRSAAAKVSDNDKLYFTFGQLFCFLARKKFKVNYRPFLFITGILAVIGGAAFLASGFSGGGAMLVAAGFLFVVVRVVAFRNRDLVSLPQTVQEFADDVSIRWQMVYRKLPARLITERKSNSVAAASQARAILVCTDSEILACLAANEVDRDLELILFHADQKNQSEAASFLQSRADLPVFLLHDASAVAYSWKKEFVNKHFGGARQQSKVYDIGLRPDAVFKSKLMQLRETIGNEYRQDFAELSQSENKWLANGNYTTLSALMPAQLINLVTRAVNRRFHALAKQNDPAALDERNAEAVGFMTWLGN